MLVSEPFPEIIFDSLKRARIKVDEAMSSRGWNAAGVFLPYRGQNFSVSGGIYYVGQATHGDWNASEAQTLKDGLSWSANFVNFDWPTADGSGLKEKQGTPFWKLLSLLCNEIFGCDLLTARDRIGWSNLLKIGAYGEGRKAPESWGHEMRNVQFDACVKSLQYELSDVTNSLVYFASKPNWNMIQQAIDYEKLAFDSMMPEANWVRYYCDGAGNVICHGPHPATRPKNGAGGSDTFMGPRSRDVAKRVAALYRQRATVL